MGNDIDGAIVKSLTEWGLAHLNFCILYNAFANDTPIESHMERLNKNVLDDKYFHMCCVASAYLEFGCKG